MKKLLFILINVLITCYGFSQVYSLPDNTYGKQFRRGKFDSTLHIPTISGSPVGKGSLVDKVYQNQSAIVFDSTNKIFWIFSPKDSVWVKTLSPTSLSSGTDINYNSSTGVINDISTFSSVTGRGATTATAISLTNTTASTSTNSGALIVSGGLGVSGNIYGGSFYLPSYDVLNSASPYFVSQYGNTDFWSIYLQNGDADKTEMVFLLGDNGTNYSAGGERWRFHYDNSGGGAAPKDVFIIDYDTSYFYNNINTNSSITALSLIKSGGTSTQFLKADGSVDGNTYLTGNQSITLSGDVTGTGATAITTTLANTAVTSGSYGNNTSVGSFTVDSKGRLTAASNTAIAFPVTSVAGRTGAVVIDTSDISNFYTKVRGVFSAGTGLSFSNGTFTNTGVTSITGTANQVIASASTGAVTLSLPQSIATTSNVTFNQVNGSSDISTQTQFNAGPMGYVAKLVGGLANNYVAVNVNNNTTKWTIGSDAGFFNVAQNRNLNFNYFDSTLWHNYFYITPSGAATFSSSITASSLIKSGATSTDALFGDGSTKTITTGTYTPTVTAVTNVSSTTSAVTSYSRNNDMVTVFGKVQITATASGTLSTISMSLPFMTGTFTSSYDAAGTGAEIQSNVYTGCTVSSNSGGNTVAISYVPATTSGDTFYFQFTYQIH